MKIILSCSARKNGEFFRYNGEKIHFVANPQAAPKEKDVSYYHPDDIIPGRNITWREYIQSDEFQSDDNNLPAYKLYKPEIFKKLYEKFGDDFYILSAGWGLIKASFKIPYYDITFSSNVSDKFKKRYKKIRFNDFNQLTDHINKDEKIIGFFGNDYLDLFYSLTKDLSNRKYVFKNSSIKKHYDNIQFIPFHSKQKRIWHYKAAEKLLEKDVETILNQ